MITVNNFDNLEKKIVNKIYELDMFIELYKTMEFYNKIPALEYKRKKQIDFYIDTFLKYNGEDQKVTELIAKTNDDIKDREISYRI